MLDSAKSLTVAKATTIVMTAAGVAYQSVSNVLLLLDEGYWRRKAEFCLDPNIAPRVPGKCVE